METLLAARVVDNDGRRAILAIFPETGFLKLAARGVRMTELPLVDRVQRAQSIIDCRLTRPAKWMGPISRELRGRTDPLIRRRVADAFNWLGQLAMRSDSRLDVDLCLNLHDYVMSSEAGTLRKGALRAGGVRIGSVRDFPKARDVPLLLHDLLARSEASADPAPVRSAALHLDLMLLHPFGDGNGRVARLVAAFVLMRQGFRSTLFTAVDQHIASAPAEYGRSLRRVTTGQRSRCEWIRAAVETMVDHVQPIVDFRTTFDGMDGSPTAGVRVDSAAWREFITAQSGASRRRLAWRLERLHAEEADEGAADPASGACIDACIRSLYGGEDAESTGTD
jgi:hypothetical protein